MDIGKHLYVSKFKVRWIIWVKTMENMPCL
jgi:hypothetical protein